MDLKIYVCSDCNAFFDSSEYIDGKCPDCGGTRVMSEEDYYRSIENQPSSTPTTQNIPKCPTCGSTKVHPISAGKKAIGFAMVGIFSKNFGKSYECDNCKYRW